MDPEQPPANEEPLEAFVTSIGVVEEEGILSFSQEESVRMDEIENELNTVRTSFHQEKSKQTQNHSMEDTSMNFNNNLILETLIDRHPRDSSIQWVNVQFQFLL